MSRKGEKPLGMWEGEGERWGTGKTGGGGSRLSTHKPGRNNQGWNHGEEDKVNMSTHSGHTLRHNFILIQFSWAVWFSLLHCNENMLITSSLLMEQGNQRHPHHHKLPLPCLIEDKRANVEALLVYILIEAFNDVFNMKLLQGQQREFSWGLCTFLLGSLFCSLKGRRSNLPGWLPG